MKKYFLPLAFFALFSIGCSNDDSGGPTPEAADYENGILVTNEGPFNNGSGTISYISDDFATVEQKIYQQVNGRDLGNLVQSMGFYNDHAYIVVSNSQKVVIANRYSFEAKDSIVSGLQNPRYFASASNTGYVTDWGDPMNNNDDYVAVVDLNTNEISTNISVPFGPEKVLAHDNKIYVAHQGGYGHNNLISVIAGNSVVTTITVGDVPNSMVVVGDYLYVLGGGKPDYSGTETGGSLVKIDLGSHQVVQTYHFDTIFHPSLLTADGNKLYYNLDGIVYKLDAANISLPGTPLFEGYFYAMEANDGMLYATDAADYASRGKLLVYDLSANQKVDEFTVGIIPGGIYFNN